MSFETLGQDNGSAQAENAPPQESQESPVDRIAKEEVEKRTPEMKRLVTRGLGDLFELLPKSKEVKKEDIVSLIEHTELEMMLPGMREKLADEMMREKINEVKDKAEFIGRSLETEAIKMFIHLEAMKGSSNDVLSRLREEREGNQQQRAGEDQAERDAKLAELRKEILGDSAKKN